MRGGERLFKIDPGGMQVPVVKRDFSESRESRRQSVGVAELAEDATPTFIEGIRFVAQVVVHGALAQHHEDAAYRTRITQLLVHLQRLEQQLPSCCIVPLV